MSKNSLNSKTLTDLNGMDTSRIETLGDGIFAIVITLLVFGLKVPTVPAGMDAAIVLPARLAAMWPTFVSWLLSFVMIGVYWQAHHGQFHRIRRVDRPLIWLNILFFMTVSLIPFSAALLGSYPFARVSVVLYGLNLIAVNLSMALHWRHATNRHYLIDEDLSPAAIKVGFRRILLPPVIYAIAILLSWVEIRASMVLFALMPMAYIFNTPVDRFFTAPLKQAAATRSLGLESEALIEPGEPSS